MANSSWIYLRRRSSCQEIVFEEQCIWKTHLPNSQQQQGPDSTAKQVQKQSPGLKWTVKNYMLYTKRQFHQIDPFVLSLNCNIKVSKCKLATRDDFWVPNLHFVAMKSLTCSNERSNNSGPTHSEKILQFCTKFLPKQLHLKERPH